MTIIEMSKTTAVSLRAVFEQLGFEEVWNASTDTPPAYRYDFGNLQLTASQVMSQYLRPVFYLYGVAVGYGSDHKMMRSLTEVSLDLPLHVESFEQGVALIAYAIGKNFEPIKPCYWLHQGREWQDYLPWVRERKAYEARPQCQVDREWLKVVRTKLKAQRHGEHGVVPVQFRFDGEILRISVGKHIFPVPAEGKAWTNIYAIEVDTVNFLPQRLMRAMVNLSVWKDHFCIDNHRWKLANLSENER